MFRSKGRFVALFLAVAMVISCFPLTAQAVRANEMGHDFEQMLEPLRQEFFSSAMAMYDTGPMQPSRLPIRAFCMQSLSSLVSKPNP